MSTCKTENYHLHVWSLEDEESLAEINENFAKLDGASRMVTGTCTGNGEARQNIDLGFAPQAVLLVAPNGHMNTGYESYGGLALPGFPVDHTAGITLGLTEGGFYITREDSHSYHTVANGSGQVTYYLAFR